MAREIGFWKKVGDYLTPVFSGGVDILVRGTDRYLNFNDLSGSTGYGLRDNAGVIEFKHDGGSWTPLAIGGGGGGDMYTAIYDPVGIAEQLVGINEIQTIANKILSNTTSIAFDTTAAVSVSQGQMAWNADEETVDLGLNGAVLQIGQEVLYHVRNNSGADIANGKPVMATGTIGASSRITAGLMNGSTATNAKLFLGITTEDIANDTDGKVTHFGKVRGIQTDGANYSETWSDGDILYIDPATTGELTNVPPSAGSLKMPIAIVIHAHATNGTLFVRASSLDENAYQPYDANLPTWPSTVDATEVGYLNGVTSAIQDQLNSKITAFADPNADRIVFWDDSASAFAALTASTGLTVSGTTMTVRSASATQTGIVELATDAETVTGTDTARATTPANITARLASPSAIGSTTPNTGKFTTVTTTGNIELGNDSDTTISRAAAGQIAVEGVTVPTISSTDTLSNKTLVSPTLTGTTTVDRLDYDRAIGAVNAIGNLGSTETFDWSLYTNFTGTLDQNTTLDFSNAVSGQKILLALSYDGTAQRTITWTPTIKWAGGTAPDAPSASGEVLVITAEYIGTTYFASYEIFS